MDLAMVRARAGSSTSTVWNTAPRRKDPGSRPASAAPAQIASTAVEILAGWVPTRMNTPSATPPAIRRARGPPAAIQIGTPRCGGRRARRRPPPPHRFSTEEGAHQSRACLQLLHARRAQTGQPHRGVPYSPAEDSPAGGQLVDGGDRSGRHARVPVDRIGEKRTERDALGRLGRGGEEDIRIPAPELGV